MTHVRFDASRADTQVIVAICKRWEKLAAPLPRDYKRLNLLMDLTACHVNGCPLRLQALLDADDFNFAHDVVGISRHINRTSGQLEDLFLPRFADIDTIRAAAAAGRRPAHDGGPQ